MAPSVPSSLSEAARAAARSPQLYGGPEATRGPVPAWRPSMRAELYPPGMPPAIATAFVVDEATPLEGSASAAAVERTAPVVGPFARLEDAQAYLDGMKAHALGRGPAPVPLRAGAAQADEGSR